MIKAIIFDCFGVLTTDNWKEFRAQLPKDQDAQLYDLTRQYDIGMLSVEQLVSRTMEVTGRTEEEVQSAILPQSNKNFQLLEYIKDLRRRGYKIGFLSNINDDWPTREFLTPEEVSLFDAIVMSFEIGFIKPDVRMYEAVTERLGLGYDECVFVDDVRRNCIAAEELGMKAVVYQNFTDAKIEIERFLS